MIPAEILKKVRRIQITTSAMVSDLFAGQYHSAFKGLGIEFEEVREYQPGDDVRTIDWNVTARTGRPFVKRFREERELTVVLLVDVSASQDFGTRAQLKSELVAELGATLAFSAIQNNDKVGLILFTDRIERFVPADKGTRHVLRVVRELLYHQPKGRQTDITVALEYLARVLTRRAVVFLISDFQSPDFSRALKRQVAGDTTGAAADLRAVIERQPEGKRAKLARGLLLRLGADSGLPGTNRDGATKHAGNP